MGGFIAQELAIRHPSRILSLTLLGCSTGARDVGQPAPEAIDVVTRLAAVEPDDHDAYAHHALADVRHSIGPGAGFDEAQARDWIELSWQRGWDPIGARRQIIAVLAHTNRTAALASLRCPALIVHGGRDTHVHPSGGHALARAIPGAQLLAIDDMGHEPGSKHWATVLDALDANTASRSRPLTGSPQTAPVDQPAVSTAVGNTLLFENDHVRVWDMQLRPGESSPLHRHNHDYLYVYVTPDNDLEVAVPGTLPVRGKYGDGHVTFWTAGRDQAPHLTHALTNCADHIHRQIIVELLGPSRVDQAQEPQRNGR